MKHNNQLPNVHLRKHWQGRVKTWFDQASRKKRRRIARQKKAVAIAPRPLDNLRPAVRSQTIRYNMKVRQGRGFSFEEIKGAGLSPKYARTIGISVDHRRRNRSQESLDRNVERLKAYMSKLVLLKSSQPVEMDTVKVLSTVFPIETSIVVEQPREITSEDTKSSAFKTLRRAINARHLSRRSIRNDSKKAKDGIAKK